MIWKYLYFEERLLKNRILKWQLFVFRIFGHIVSEADRFKSFHLVRGLLNAIILLYLLVAGIMAIRLDHTIIDKVVMIIAAFILYANILIKIIFFYFNQKQYLKLIEFVYHGAHRLLEEKIEFVEKLYEKYIKDTNRTNTIIIGLLLLSSSMNILDATYFIATNFNGIVNDNGSSNITRAPIFDMFPTWSLSNNFVLVYLLPIYLELLGSFGLYAWTTFNTNLLRYASFKLDVIIYKLQQLNNNSITSIGSLGPTSTQNYQDLCHRQLLVNCTKEITEVKEFTVIYESVTKYIVFIESTTATALLCIIMYQMSKDTSIYGIYLPWIAAMLGILFMYYWFANEITVKSDKICTALYMSEWYELSVCSQKDALIFMNGCMKPIFIKAVLWRMNTSSFLMIVKTSYTYFTLLSNLADTGDM